MCRFTVRFLKCNKLTSDNEFSVFFFTVDRQEKHFLVSILISICCKRIKNFFENQSTNNVCMAKVNVVSFASPKEIIHGYKVSYYATLLT